MCAPQALWRSNFFSLEYYSSLLDLPSDPGHTCPFPSPWISSVEGWVNHTSPVDDHSVVFDANSFVFKSSYKMFTTLCVFLIYVNGIVLWIMFLFFTFFTQHCFTNLSMCLPLDRFCCQHSASSCISSVFYLSFSSDGYPNCLSSPTVTDSAVMKILVQSS